MRLRASALSTIVLLSAWACDGDGPSGTEPVPFDMRGAWLASARIFLFPESPTGPRFCEDGDWTGILEIETQNGGSFTGTVDFDFEASAGECAQEFALEESIDGSVTVDEEVTFVIGSLGRMRELVEEVTRCSVVLPIEAFSGFAGETGEGALVEEAIIGSSSTRMECLPDDDDTDHAAHFSFLATIRLPPDSPLLPR